MNRFFDPIPVAIGLCVSAWLCLLYTLWDNWLMKKRRPSGIYFGSSADTNLYRTGAYYLTTDDTFKLPEAPRYCDAYGEPGWFFDAYSEDLPDALRVVDDDPRVVYFSGCVPYIEYTL